MKSYPFEDFGHNSWVALLGEIISDTNYLKRLKFGNNSSISIHTIQMRSLKLVRRNYQCPNIVVWSGFVVHIQTLTHNSTPHNSSILFTSFEANSNRINHELNRLFINVIGFYLVECFVLNRFCIEMKCQYDQKEIDFQSTSIVKYTHKGCERQKALP